MEIVDHNAQEVTIECNLSDPVQCLRLLENMLTEALSLIHSNPPKTKSMLVLYIQPGQDGTPLLSVLTKEADGAIWERGEVAMIPYTRDLTVDSAFFSLIAVIAGRRLGALLKMSSLQTNSPANVKQTLN